jgi:hypothetical protein
MSRTRTFFTFAGFACLLAAPSTLAGATAQTRAAPSTFPLGTFETIITAQDVARAGLPAKNAHYETLTFRSNGTWRDVWFHPRRADQEPFGGHFTVKGNVLRLLPTTRHAAMELLPRPAHPSPAQCSRRFRTLRLRHPPVEEDHVDKAASRNTPAHAGPCDVCVHDG